MTDEQDERCTLTPVDRARLLRLPSVVVTVTPAQGLAIEAELAMRPLIVGTSADADLVIADPQVSRRHCELQLTGEGIVSRDLGSKNGTRVGKLVIREALLPPSVP